MNKKNNRTKEQIIAELKEYNLLIPFYVISYLIWLLSFIAPIPTLKDTNIEASVLLIGPLIGLILLLIPIFLFFSTNQEKERKKKIIRILIFIGLFYNIISLFLMCVWCGGHPY